MSVLDRLAPSVTEQLNKFQSEALTPLKFTASEAVDAMNKITRSPWIMTCDTWLDRTDPNYIVMNPNPRDTTWTIPLRSSMVKTAAGTVTYVWRDPSRQNTIFDEPILEMTMQSGSLLPKVSTVGLLKEQGLAATKRVTPDFPGKDIVSKRVSKSFDRNNYTHPDGLKTFYQFLNLFNVERINAKTGEPNYIRLVLNTLLFPKLTIRGMFVPDETLTWTESVDSPSSIEWKIRFVISRITPNLGVWDVTNLLELWKQEGGGSAFRSPPRGIEGQYKAELKQEFEDDKDRIEAAQLATEKSLNNRQNAAQAEVDEAKADKAMQDEENRLASANLTKEQNDALVSELEAENPEYKQLKAERDYATEVGDTEEANLIQAEMDRLAFGQTLSPTAAGISQQGGLEFTQI